jgi:hypothetical protein
MRGSPRLVVRPSGFPSGHRGFGHGRGFPLLYPFPVFDSFYPDDFTAQPYAQPAVVIVQPAPPVHITEPPAPVPSEPLLIELRGDNYVKLSGASDSKTQTVVSGDSAGTLQKRAPLATIPKPRPVLVFRDGHQEEIFSYTISGGVLYANADYYSSESWNRAIQMSSLNVPQTIASNQSRGVAFRLPGSPNEVIVGP